MFGFYKFFFTMRGKMCLANHLQHGSAGLVCSFSDHNAVKGDHFLILRRELFGQNCIMVKQNRSLYFKSIYHYEVWWT